MTLCPPGPATHRQQDYTCAHAGIDLPSLVTFYHHRGLEPRTHWNYDTIAANVSTFCQSKGLAPWPIANDSLGSFCVHYCHVLKRTTRSLPNIFPVLKDHCVSVGLPWLSEVEQIRLKRLKRGLRKHDRTQVRRKFPVTLRRLWT